MAAKPVSFLLVCGAIVLALCQGPRVQSPEVAADRPSPFVANLGQWEHPGRFVLRSSGMTVFLEERGWTLNLTESQQAGGVALRMSFQGGRRSPSLVGEGKLPGHHNYFLGNDRSRWRTDVPLYAAVRYEDLYPAIDLRLRESNGHPEYDLLLEPGAELDTVSVLVEGADDLHIDKDGSLVIETPVGPLTQPVPQTWQLRPSGQNEMLVCRYVLLGPDRFGFEVPGWEGSCPLTIDPGLLWSTYLGGNGSDFAGELSVDASGVVTVAGSTASSNYPTTSGAYDTTFIGTDGFVTRLDPTKNGTSQLVYSTFLGGSLTDGITALSVDGAGMITLAGGTSSSDFPTTTGAYDTTYKGGGGAFRGDVFVSRLDPSKQGAAQLVYSTFLGGSGYEEANALAIDAGGAVTIAGRTSSKDYPTTASAYDTTFNGGGNQPFDVFVSQLLLVPALGSKQLRYSTYLGGNLEERLGAVAVEASGVVTVAGQTMSKDFPTTNGAYDTIFNDGSSAWWDGFVSRLDPQKTGASQLVYSTFLGGNQWDVIYALFVDSRGLVTVGGEAAAGYPTTAGAYDTTNNGGEDAFVSQLDLKKAAASQLVYSTLLGGNARDAILSLHVDAGGVITAAGFSNSMTSLFPTTAGAYDTTHNGGGQDAIVSRLDPAKTGAAQLVYSTLLGGSGFDSANALAVDGSGVVTVAGTTTSSNYPTTSGAFDTSYNGGSLLFPTDPFVSRLDMGVAFRADVHQLSLKRAGTQKLTLNAGKQHAGRLYWVFGSVTGTRPGINLGGVHFPLNPDAYTDFAFAFANTAVFNNFRGTLDSNGSATASFNVPSGLPSLPSFTLHHAYLVYDSQRRFFMVSNPVPLMLQN